MWWPGIKKTPLRRQIDPIECGAVCLGIILEYYGHNVANAALRKAVNTSRTGSDAASLVKASRRFGLIGDARRFLLSDLEKLRSLAVLFFDQSHFVVFEGYFAGRFYINDPARGRYSLSRQEARKRFSHLAITLTKSKEFTCIKKPARSIMKNSHSAYFCGIGFFAGAFFALLALALGLIATRKVVNLDFLTMLTGVAFLFVLLVFSYVLAWRALKQLAFLQCGNEVGTLTTKLVDLPFSFFDNLPFVTFARIFESAMDRALFMIKSVAMRNFYFGFSAAVLVVVTFISLPIAGLLLLLLMTLWVQGAIKQLNPSTKPSVDPIILQTQIKNVESIRAMGQDEHVLDALVKHEIDVITREQNDVWHHTLCCWIWPVALFLITFTWLAQILWQSGDLLTEELCALLLLSFGLAYGRITIATQKKHHLALEADSLLTEMESFETNTEERVIDNDALILLRLVDVTFSYTKDAQEIFHSVNLEIKRNEIIAVVGPPLSGVSTLMHLMGGKLKPTSGKIVHRVRENAPFRIANIDEDADLFAGTLKDNLCLFDHNIDDHAIVAALKDACATDLFYRRPLGLLAPIAWRGKNLSAGEKQRLLLAQALLHQPDLVLLSSFFETLEETTAQQILAHLRQKNLGVVFTSYQAALLAKCDAVIWIDGSGQVIYDRHENLMTTNEAYQNLIIPPHQQET